MVGCSANGCSNRHEKGFIMKYFPKDPIRRKAWVEKVNRRGWSATDYSALCEVHFEPSMWEKTRVDGTKKLKMNAIPTIFPPKPKVLKSKQDNLHDDNKVKNSPAKIDKINTSNANLKLSAQTTTPLDHVSYTNKTKPKAKPASVDMLCTYTKKARNEENLQLIKSELQQVLKVDMPQQNKTITNGLKLKFASGNNIYEELLRQGLPIPSRKLLTEHLLNLNFTGGILYEVFDIFNLKVLNFSSDIRNDCVVFLEEIPITSADVYDAAMDADSANMTINNHCGTVTHVLVVILGGIHIWWKQIVAFYYTGNFVDAAVYEDILCKIIDKTERTGLNVASIIFNMNPVRQALCTKWRINEKERSEIKNYITHPLDPTRKICILANISYLLKNITNIISRNENVMIPHQIQQRHNLADNIVKSRHIEDLINLQESLNFKLVPKSIQANLMPQNFKNRTQPPAKHTCDVITALKFVADKIQKPEYKTTAWLIETVEKWFTILTTAHPTTDLKKPSLDSSNQSRERSQSPHRSFLKDFIELFCQMQISGKAWNSQTVMEVILTTQSIVNIQNLFLNQKGYDNLYISRFTQHGLNNLFKAIKSEGYFTVAELQNCLKLICVAQLLKDVTKDKDEEEEEQLLLVELLNVKKQTELSN